MMFKKEYLSRYITGGLTAAIAYSLTVFYFIYSAQYSETWWLYVGNILFLIAIALFSLKWNKAKRENESTQTLNAAGHIATILGIIFSCIIAVIILTVFIPDIFSAGKADTTLEDAPAQTGTGKTNGLVFILFMNTIIGNLIGGSFISIIIPFTAKKNQTKDKKSEVLNN